MGLLGNQSGIMRRFLREQGSWENHLQKTRSCILSEVHREKPKTISILGSGWLLDVPLMEIIEAGIKVNLVDIAHPSKVVHKFRNSPDIKLIDFDITGGAIDAAWAFSKSSEVGSYAKFLKEISGKVNWVEFEADLYLSINLLSQLHVHIVDFLLRKKKISQEQSVEVSRVLQQSHINSLPKGKSLLVTDFEEELYDEEEKLSATKPRVYTDISCLSTIDSWTWNFDSCNEFYPDFNVKLNVSAFRI